jgi:hypothetical protein
MQTYQSPCGSPRGSPRGSSNGSRLNNDFPGTPSRVLFGGGDDKYLSPPKKQKLETGSVPLETGSVPISGPPPEIGRKKASKNPAGPIKGLPVLPNGFEPKIAGELGEGFFGKVFQVRFPGDDTSSYAMKVVEVVPGGRSSPIDLRIEASNYGSPKCNFGFGMSSPDGRQYFGFSCIAEPLDNAPITPENIEEMDSKTRDAIMGANFALITDASLENMGIVRAGTPTPILGEDGLPCAGSLVEQDKVVIIDGGEFDSPNDCNGKYGALFDEDAMESLEAQLKYRRFKCDVVSALLRNRLLAEPRNEYDIVREICKKYGYTYAAGDRR